MIQTQLAAFLEGQVSAALGINGYPSAAEEIIISRDIRLAKLANAPFVKVEATKIRDAGYTFQHPELIPALQHLFKEGI